MNSTTVTLNVELTEILTDEQKDLGFGSQKIREES